GDVEHQPRAVADEDLADQLDAPEPDAEHQHDEDRPGDRQREGEAVEEGRHCSWRDLGGAAGRTTVEECGREASRAERPRTAARTVEKGGRRTPVEKSGRRKDGHRGGPAARLSDKLASVRGRRAALPGPHDRTAALRARRGTRPRGRQMYTIATQSP